MFLGGKIETIDESLGQFKYKRVTSGPADYIFYKVRDGKYESELKLVTFLHSSAF